MCDIDDFESSSSNMDFFDDDKNDSFDLFDGVLDTDTEVFSKKSKVIRVYPNGDMQLEKVNFASISTHEEKELIDYLNNGSRGRPTPTPKTSDSENPRQANASRKRSLTDDSIDSSSAMYLNSNEGACMSKSAVAARENRKKKKKHTQELETTVEKLQTENTSLKTKNSVLQSSLDQLETEVKYLKSVIANQTTLAHLIGNIQNTPGVKFQTSLTVDRYNKENIKDINDNTVTRSVIVPVESRKNKNENKQIGTMCTRYGKQRKDTSATSVPKEIKPGKKDDQFEPCPSSTCTAEQNSNEKSGQTTAGVCLHVSDGSVSLEFCANCASSAAFAKAITYDHSYGKVQGKG
ncbi:uncharacterized protein LOC117324438 [Pecten maximus]|uniref:uncharacterized protein LOC117324438 n=1 Tax=Pecten maximus TaxID=6579 RepID=UPI00145863F7|nr:uncharacterized protein LOC117324438 [Pecten maximus]